MNPARIGVAATGLLVLLLVAQASAEPVEQWVQIFGAEAEMKSAVRNETSVTLWLRPERTPAGYQQLKWFTSFNCKARYVVFRAFDGNKIDGTVVRKAGSGEPQYPEPGSGSALNMGLLCDGPKARSQ
jgi:hypothetical protein